MANADDTEAAAPPRGGMKGILAGLGAGLLLGGASFATIYLGVVDPRAMLGARETAASGIVPLEPIGFVTLDPIIISLPRGAAARHLRFLGQLEVVPAHADEVVALMPRIHDVLNTYLRAVELRDLEQPAATVWLRAQMLRRVQVVTGEGRVRDLLISEFVFN
jgi:flagellar protein FliL